MALLDRLNRLLHSKNQNKDHQAASEQIDKSSTEEESVSRKQLSDSDASKQKRVALLTPREHDLYLLLLEGYTLKECSKRLSVKYSTANTHMTGIYRKLGVNSRAELIIDYRGIDV